MMKSIILPDEVSTLNFAAQCAIQWRDLMRQKKRLIVILDGDLGAGKTTFARGLLHALGYEGTVKSPTYTLLETYQLVDFSVFHFDLYRFQTPEEWEDSGFDDCLDEKALWLIEWASRAQPYLPDADLTLSFKVLESGRCVEILT